jgi:hypothetical protein
MIYMSKSYNIALLESRVKEGDYNSFVPTGAHLLIEDANNKLEYLVKTATSTRPALGQWLLHF